MGGSEPASSGEPDTSTGAHGGQPRPEIALPAEWNTHLNASLTTLRQLAGSTEQEFLAIGRQIQGIYQTAAILSQSAGELVAIASGERIQVLIDQLRRILQEMETYLEQIQVQGANNTSAMHRVEELLEAVDQPLEGFKKMSKNLYILEVLFKTESATVGESGQEFNNLAKDINTLSQQIKEKSQNVFAHRQMLAGLIHKNIGDIHRSRSTQESEIQTSLASTAGSISEIEQVNEQFSMLGNAVSMVAQENSASIGDVVQSVQYHDIFRQQVEHVIEGLEEIQALQAAPDLWTGHCTQDQLQEKIGKIGDVCELQEAQLHFASSDLHAAVTAIVDNLHDISRKQRQLTDEISARADGIEGSGASFIGNVQRHMASVTCLLEACSENGHKEAGFMQEILSTVDTIATFVSDIESIGQDVILIALNARIKAAGTGREGASLCVLAEEVGRIAKEDTHRTDTITAALTEIHEATLGLVTESESREARLGGTLDRVRSELQATLATLTEMGTALLTRLEQVRSQGRTLTKEIERVTAAIDVHERTQTLADGVLDTLRGIIAQSRQLCPASESFREELRQMAERYTMASERRIHDAIAAKHGVSGEAPAMAASDVSKDESEFGDNVDLF